MPEPGVRRGLAVGHLVDDRHDLVDRDREAEPDGAALVGARGARGLDGGVDADHVPVEVDQRAAAVAGVDRRVGLDGRVDRAVALASPTPRRRAGSSALTMPLVTVDSRPNGEPIATTPWPTARSEDLPIVAGVRPLTFSAWITAVSVSGSVPRTLALAEVPSLKETEMLPEPPAIATTWLLVRIWPSELRMMPEPEPASCGPDTSILTTDGSTSWATCSTEPVGRGLVGAVHHLRGGARGGRPTRALEPVVLPHWSQAAAPATPAAPPTSSDVATTEAAKADRPLRRVVVGPPGGVGGGPPAGGHRVRRRVRRGSGRPFARRRDGGGVGHDSEDVDPVCDVPETSLGGGEEVRRSLWGWVS